MEKIYKLLSFFGVLVILCVVGISGGVTVFAETDFEIQQKYAEQVREAQKKIAEQ